MNDLSFDLQSKSFTIGDTEFLFFYRSFSEGDCGVIGQVLEGKCFDIEKWHQGRVARAYYDHLVGAGRVPLIVDAGANIGAASRYFRAKYPRSNIVAIEPERDNVSILKRNLDVENVRIISGGIGARLGRMWLQDPGLSDWGFRVGTNGSYEVEVLSMDDLIDQSHEFVPFIAKIDIEGGESELFKFSSSWFDKFAVIIFETHDWMIPFGGLSMGLLRAASSGAYDVLFKGENLFFFNHRFLLDHHNPF